MRQSIIEGAKITFEDKSHVPSNTLFSNCRILITWDFFCSLEIAEKRVFVFGINKADIPNTTFENCFFTVMENTR